VIAESFERIHRSNLVGMGILPLQFEPGQSRHTLGLTGRETYDILGIADALAPGCKLRVLAHGEAGQTVEFWVRARIDTPNELAYYRNGGILPYVFRQLVRAKA